MTQKPSQEEERYMAEQEVARRKAAERQTERSELRGKEVEGVLRTLGIEDRELGEHLVDLGFDAATVAAFPFIPLVYVAWADGDVTSRERDRVIQLAQDRGLDPAGPAFKFLQDLLDRRPREDFLDTCVVAIRRIFEGRPGGADAAKTDLVSLSLSIAETSGGFLGLFGAKVSESEREVIKEIIEDLGLQDSGSAADLLAKLG